MEICSVVLFVNQQNQMCLISNAISMILTVAVFDRGKCCLDFGNHAAFRCAAADECGGASLGEPRHKFAFSIENALHVGQHQKSLGFKGRSKRSGRRVSIYVECLAFIRCRNRREDGNNVGAQHNI